MSDSAAEWVGVDALIPWADNPRDNEAAVQTVADSIKRFGFASPIIARRADGEVIAGHTRLKAARRLGLDRVPVRYMDLDPTDARLLALADNKLGELADWSDGLADVLRILEEDGADLDGLGFSDEEMEELCESGIPSGADDVYTGKIDSPIYEIKGERPDESDLYDASRSGELRAKIDALDLDDKVKSFLLAAADRHTAFRYDRIAEYYAHAPPEVQELMEDSALVIIDYDKAIELGFVRLTKELGDAYRDDYDGHPKRRTAGSWRLDAG